MPSPILIKKNNVFGQVYTKLTQTDLEYIATKTRFRPPGYDKTWNFKNGRWDGYTHTFNYENQSFRVGLLERILNILKFLGYAPEVKYTDEFAVTYNDITVGPSTRKFEPLPFQLKVKDITRDHSRGIIASPTGTGKTVMASLIVEEHQKRTLIVVNDLVLLDQMHRTLTRSLPEAKIGYIGNLEFELGDIVVATIQSLASILGLITKKKPTISPNRDELKLWLAKCNIVIHDEAHLADADTSLMLYGVLDNPDKVFGFSATPYGWAWKQQKSANVELEQIFGKVIYNTFDNDFVALGLKVQSIVKSVQVPYRVKTYGTSFRDNQAILYKKALMYEIIQDPNWHNTVKAQVDEFNAEGASCFVFASHSLEYGETLARLLDAPFVQGKTPRKERFGYFDALQDKKIMCIVSDIGSIGLDIPSLDAFILASDVKDVRQMKGRVERAFPGKSHGYLVDMWKDCSFLNSHHDTRMHQYVADGSMVL
jgi:DNA excision repair protein ERCC-3